MPNVYFVGAAGAGKTTLADYVASRYGRGRLPSAARSVMQEYGLSDERFAEMLADTVKYAEYQMRVAKRQISMEADSKFSFASDRAFDHLAYAALYGNSLKQIMDQGFMQAYIGNLLETKAIIFLVRPSKETMIAARKEGKRTEFLVWDDMCRFDGMVQFLLEAYGIPYVPISVVEMKERKRIVDGVLQYNGFVPIDSMIPVDQASPEPEEEEASDREILDPEKRYNTVLPNGNLTSVSATRVLGDTLTWLKANGLGLSALNLADLAPDCPLSFYRLRNEDACEVISAVRKAWPHLSRDPYVVSPEEITRAIEESRIPEGGV